MQLWLLAEWVCSEGGRPVRKPLAGELVRLIDATITAAVRQQIEQRSGSAALAARLAPRQPEEALSAERAQLLWAVLTSRAGQAVPMPQLSAGLFGLPGEPGEGEFRAHAHGTAGHCRADELLVVARSQAPFHSSFVIQAQALRACQALIRPRKLRSTPIL